MMKTLAFAGALCLLAGTAQAADGILIVQKTTVGAGAPQVHRTQMDARRMRAETASSTVIVFDGVKQTMMIIDDAKKSYSEITKAQIEAMSAQVSGMMAQMQEQLKSLPPEQRAQMEAMMKGRGGAMPGMPVTKTQFRKTGTGTAGKWTCDKYEGYQGEKKVSDICTVDAKALGVTEADFAIGKEMAAFFAQIMPAGASQMLSPGSADQGFSGIPVRSVSSVGAQTVTTEITEVSRQAVPDSAFQAPAGYQKTEFPGMGRGRGR